MNEISPGDQPVAEGDQPRGQSGSPAEAVRCVGLELQACMAGWLSERLAG